jgi:hypothetical protein
MADEGNGMPRSNSDALLLESPLLISYKFE